MVACFMAATHHDAMVARYGRRKCSDAKREETFDVITCRRQTRESPSLA
jgi:hypothetical protein